MTDHLEQIDDVDDDAQILQVVDALEDDLPGVPQDEITALATISYEDVAAGARVRSFLPVLAERRARDLLRELASA